MRRFLASKNSMIDYLLIVSGVGLNFFGASTDDGRPVPLSNLAFLLLAVFAASLASFAMAKCIRIIPLAIAASIAITDFLIALYVLCRIPFLDSVHGHWSEALIFLPLIMVANASIAVVLSSIGFGRLARRYYDRK
jgi:cellulose synthase/poly-beta-1,6-N-acetylglucosamine synthase-like glycosyltransferase